MDAVPRIGVSEKAAAFDAVIRHRLCNRGMGNENAGTAAARDHVICDPERLGARIDRNSVPAVCQYGIVFDAAAEGGFLCAGIRFGFFRQGAVGRGDVNAAAVGRIDEPDAVFAYANFAAAHLDPVGVAAVDHVIPHLAALKAVAPYGGLKLVVDRAI